MSFELIDEQDAPLPKKRPTRTAGASDAVIAALVPGKVAKVPVPKGTTIKGAKVSLRRAAQRVGREVTLWDANDDYVYVKLVSED